MKATFVQHTIDKTRNVS